MRGLVVVLVAGCGGAILPPLPPAISVTPDLGGRDGAVADLAPAPADLAPELPDIKPQCEWSGAPGSCMSSTACAAITDHTGESATSCAMGEVCCIDTPNTADNPLIPAGYKIMTQAMVTQAMTDWAVMILHDPINHPMYSTDTKQFGAQLVLARVEWHAPDFLNGVIHRGVTLYVPK